MKPKLHSGFTLLELAIAVFLVALIGVSAANGMRTSLRVLSGTEASSLAVAATREFHEYTRSLDVASLDLLPQTTSKAIMGDGQELPGAEELSLQAEVKMVDDQDPSKTVAPGSSQSRLITLSCWHSQRKVMETAWLLTEH